MRIVLEDQKTKKFLGARGWTREQGSARDFRSSVAALDYCFQKQIREVRILLAFDEKKFNFYLDPFSLSAKPQHRCRQSTQSRRKHPRHKVFTIPARTFAVFHLASHLPKPDLPAS
jgi:hypothetical protein